MTTALDIIQAAFEEVRVYAPGETISAADSARALWVLNGMLDSWSNENLMCYAITEQSTPLTVGKTRYSVGVGGDVSVTRPLRIMEGPGAAYLQDTQGNNFPVDVVPQDAWNQIGNRSVTSDIPDTIFYDPQYPLAYLNVFPTPSNTYTLFWDSWLPFTQFSSLAAVMSLPPGYQDAIQHNLALRLKVFFKGAQVDPIIIELARDTKAAIKRTNLKPVVANYDGEIIAKASGTYNIYRDGRGGGS